MNAINDCVRLRRLCNSNATGCGFVDSDWRGDVMVNNEKPFSESQNISTFQKPNDEMLEHLSKRKIEIGSKYPSDVQLNCAEIGMLFLANRCANTKK